MRFELDKYPNLDNGNSIVSFYNHLRLSEVERSDLLISKNAFPGIPIKL
jgi:hypothetical protein